MEFCCVDVISCDVVLNIGSDVIITVTMCSSDVIITVAMCSSDVIIIVF